MSDVIAAPIIQSYIVPIVAFDQQDGQAYYRKLIGTAFFVGSCSIFVTAKHVIEQANAFVNSGNAQNWAISGKLPTGGSFQDAIFPITGLDYAPEPFDIAVGCSSVPVESPIKFAQTNDVTGWDVATIGYPESALNSLPQDFRIRLRTHKGYVQRLMDPEDFRLGTHAKSFELSFNISHGLSGAPLIVQVGPDAGKCIGVCVGSFRTQLVDYVQLIVEEDGRRFEEKHLMIEAYGIAHDISPILDWTPFSSGVPLRNL